MRENDGRKLDHQTFEDIRMRSVDQSMNNGATVKDIAATLGLRDATVYGWVKLSKDRGADALLAKPIPGRPSNSPRTKFVNCTQRFLGRIPGNLVSTSRCGLDGWSGS